MSGDRTVSRRRDRDVNVSRKSIELPAPVPDEGTEMDAEPGRWPPPISVGPGCQWIVDAGDFDALAQAASSRLPAIVIDLGASGPETRSKEQRRRDAVRALTSLAWEAKTKVVRIHHLDTPWACDDIEHIVLAAGRHVDALSIPGIRRPADIYLVEALMAQAEQLGGGPRQHPIGIHAEVSLETLDSDWLTPALATSERLQTIVLDRWECAFVVAQETDGPETFADNGTATTLRRRLDNLMAIARAAGICLVDAAAGHDVPTAALRRACRLASAMGFVGKRSRRAEHADTIDPVFQAAHNGRFTVRERLEHYEMAVSGEGHRSIRHGEGGGMTFVPFLAE